MKQSPVNNDRKTPSSKVFEESEIDQESCGSSSEDTETYSPKSVVSRTMIRPVKNANVDVFGPRARNQIERIRAEDSHIGEDIGECFIVKICGAGLDEDVSRPASPLSRINAVRMNTSLKSVIPSNQHRLNTDDVTAGFEPSNSVTNVPNLWAHM
ncbi:hypothetical protein R6Q57_012031 [Mikania cordata]